MKFLLQVLTWWNGQTLGTRLHTWRYGQHVGDDEQGNKFYQTKDGKRRWVIFNGEAEASRVSADWHGWLHHTFDERPTATPLLRRDWQLPHLPNLTGSDLAYRPPGSIVAAAPERARDYEAWQPE